jgi:hypothetical protein
VKLTDQTTQTITVVSENCNNCKNDLNKNCLNDLIARGFCNKRTLISVFYRAYFAV